MARQLLRDRQILEDIYEHYEGAFRTFPPGSRQSKIYVPIDIQSIADRLGADGNSIYGRLYYHLDAKYRYKQNDGTSVHLFTLKAGDDPNCVHFPFLEAVLASLRFEERKFWLPIMMSAASLGISTLLAIIKLVSG